MIDWNGGEKAQVRRVETDGKAQEGLGIDHKGEREDTEKGRIDKDGQSEKGQCTYTQ